MARRTNGKNADNKRSLRDKLTGKNKATTAPDLPKESQVSDAQSTNVSDKTPVTDEVVVQENNDGEAVNGTTKQGSTEPVKNTDKIPQNGVTEVEVLPVTDNDVAREADAARTEEEVKFSDESNPNQKGRQTSAGKSEYDQDGNLRTDGYSYGVAPDDVSGVSENAFKENEGKKSDESDNKFEGKRVFVADARQEERTNTEDTNVELSSKDVENLEEELSFGNIQARVVSSTNSFTKVKFYKNNKPFVTYKSRGQKFDKEEAKAFVQDALKQEG